MRSPDPGRVHGGPGLAPPPHLQGERVVVTLADEPDARGLLEFHTRNAEHLRPWMPPIPADMFTMSYWQRWVRAARQLYMKDQAVRLVMRLASHADGPVLGQINLSNIVRGAFQAAHMGYHVDARVEGRGLMREALECVVDWAFDDLRLHRIMANHIPDNERSAGLLQRLGFEVEGYAKAYLYIDGEWRDHVLTAKINPRPAPPGPRPAPAPPASGLFRRR